ncbi:uncharacterized protein PFL1_03143 [Pseudozyma flocculosa PF-1]|uniref:Protein-lysine N-methyltransferase EFM6 n=2 Tax=Pseudozyma flocculosa TaxID=84751 RepID=A0A5C3F370_9BASI|nr:uncharacterized protein PFL1_03143 [Pseudozyma flocculosa PF-1]EPQ29388.1 hypothetical protein PFL1_03143 [Pseudozyma flocculosa PF-1]SPO37909.1 uncharacterized protein PSFLO_03386 [Pseudozyma flocculosa]
MTVPPHDDGAGDVSGYRNSLEEAEALDAIDPLRHFLAASPCPDDHDNGNGDDDDDDGKDMRDVRTATDFSIVPVQRDSIINQRVTIRYYTDASVAPITFDPASPPPASPTTTATVEGDGEGQRGRAWYDVVLTLDMTEGCGGKIWPAAEVLGAYIASKHAPAASSSSYSSAESTTSSGWKGKTVVELGSGTGLVGFLVAKMGLGCRVWVTDQIPMLPLMTSNHALNQAEMVDPCLVEELNWGQPLPATVPHKPDVLLLADCVYLEVAFQPLVDTMLALSGPSTEILFCYQKRRKADKRFFNLLKRHFTFADVQDDDEQRTRAYRRQGTQLLRVVKKQTK